MTLQNKMRRLRSVSNVSTHCQDGIQCSQLCIHSTVSHQMSEQPGTALSNVRCVSYVPSGGSPRPREIVSVTVELSALKNSFRCILRTITCRCGNTAVSDGWTDGRTDPTDGFKSSVTDGQYLCRSDVSDWFCRTDLTDGRMPRTRRHHGSVDGQIDGPCSTRLRGLIGRFGRTNRST